ncbi:hypothetical protein PRIPAC_88880 [Pristionchus pacificus]|uniref:Uncharacterized protein n=1 Tax=Pristionchus pacificus TaxID=54126 RepID=A0A8R1Z682_PRIPA|nr:hypothetical protein PRIPAC_88880 [Pristionchus pacificus]
MAAVREILEFKEKVWLGDTILCGQIADGTRFYYQLIDDVLYLRFQQFETFTKIPGNLFRIARVGDSIILHTKEKKLHRVKFIKDSPPQIVFFRDIAENEHYGLESIMGREVGGDHFYYRISETPEKGSIRIDLSDEELEDAYPTGIHRGKIVYNKRVYGLAAPRIINASQNIIIIEHDEILANSRSEGSHATAFLADDSSPLIYLINIDGKILVANTENLQIAALKRKPQPGDNMKNTVFRWTNIVGIHDGIITCEGRTLQKGCAYCVYSAPLPTDSMGKESVSTEPKADLEPLLKLVTLLTGKEVDMAKLTQLLGAATASTPPAAPPVDTNDAKMAEMQAMIDKLSNKLTDLDRSSQQKIQELESKLAQKEDSVTSTSQSVDKLSFTKVEDLADHLVCFQVENGTLFYFKNYKPHQLFTVVGEKRVEADLSALNGATDCSFKGTIGNRAYFTSVVGKKLKFHSATFTDGQIDFHELSEVKTTDISLLPSQPYYCLEKAKEWNIFRYDESFSSSEGETFDISEVDYLRKYEGRYHRGHLYLFRESAEESIKKVNDKVITIEHPLLEDAFYHVLQHSDFIYILNGEEHVLLILDTESLQLIKFPYESPKDCDAHSIVGVRDGIITVKFEGSFGRHLASSRIPDI